MTFRHRFRSAHTIPPRFPKGRESGTFKGAEEEEEEEKRRKSNLIAVISLVLFLLEGRLGQERDFLLLFRLCVKTLLALFAEGKRWFGS